MVVRPSPVTCGILRLSGRCTPSAVGCLARTVLTASWWCARTAPQIWPAFRRNLWLPRPDWTPTARYSWWLPPGCRSGWRHWPALSRSATASTPSAHRLSPPPNNSYAQKIFNVFFFCFFTFSPSSSLFTHLLFITMIKSTCIPLSRWSR